MTENKKYSLLASPLFLFSLFVLLLNDFILKYSSPGVISGKLSDFCGLFIFPFFFAVFFPRAKYFIFLASGLLFVIWKSSASEGFIDWFNSFGFPRIQRVVDYTDLIALIVLPFSHLYFNQRLVKPSANSRLQTVVISSIALFSFCSTSVAHDRNPVHVEIGKTYEFPIAKSHLLKEHLNFSSYGSAIRNDSILYLYFRPKSFQMVELAYLIRLNKINQSASVLKLDSFIGYEVFSKHKFIDEENIKKFVNSINRNGATILFEEAVVNKLRCGKKLNGSYVRTLSFEYENWKYN